jgi:hypothetical protein
MSVAEDFTSDMSTRTQPLPFLPVVAITIVAIVALFWVATVTLPMGFMPQEYAMWQARRDMVSSCSLGRIVIQGDSRAAAGFLPGRLGDATNVAFGGASSVETYYAAEQILHCAKAPERVLLSLSPHQFSQTTFFWNRSVPFNFLSFRELEEIRRTSRALNDPAFYGTPKLGDWDAILEDALHAAYFPSYYTRYIVNHLLMGRWKDNHAAYAETLATRGQHYYGTVNGISVATDEVDLKTFTTHPLFDAYLKRLIDAYAARGVPVDFVSVPINRITYDRLPQAFIDGEQRYLESIAATHPNFRVIGPAVVAMDDADFGDEAHLNEHGAAVFSDRVAAWLAADRATMHR